MLNSTGYRSEATAVALARECRLAWRLCLLTLFAIAFMAALPTSRALSASEVENYRVANDLAVYPGVLPAAMVRGHPKGHPEARMHGGAPGGTHQYHIVIAIFDARSRARIENTGVTATVSGLGHVGTKTIALQPMAIAGTITYGNFVTLPGTDRYSICLEIAVPGRRHPARLSFEYQHTR